MSDHVHAFVRAHATLRLLEQLDAETLRSVVPGRMTFGLVTPGGPRCSITIRSGKASFREGRRFGKTGALWFPTPGHMAAVLSSEPGMAIPVPTSFRFIGAVKKFQKLTGALKEQFAVPDRRPRMLLLGTLYALQEVARHDPYVAARVRRIPDGLIEVRAADDNAHHPVSAWFSKSGSKISTGADGFATNGDKANAVLEFRDPASATALLTGETPAMLALADRSVRLYGRIPMIQNLFPILDRVAHYMGASS